MSETLYYVVRKDLTWAQRAVQLVHAREQWVEDCHGFEYVCTAVVFGVPDLAELERVFAELPGGTEYDVSAFHEPDLGGEMTALCTDKPLGGLTLL